LNKHVAKQKVFDAVKRVREEGEAWVTLDGERLFLRAVPNARPDYGDCVVRGRRGIVRARFSTKDAYPRVRIDDAHGYTYLTSWDNVLALIIETHPREGGTDAIATRRS
jgi:hypothetical protein